MNTQKKFQKEILECLTEHVEDLPENSSYSRKKYAEHLLIQTFSETGGNYQEPTYKDLLAAMKRLAVREMKKQKDSHLISKNFMTIARKIKDAEYSFEKPI